MPDSQTFPRFIVDAPNGNDCFEGKSQEKLAQNICGYIKTIDTKPQNVEGNEMPRIIGIEGGWGTGKSNVVKMIDKELASHAYYTFTYDAWGHQEDLQRRSILETLTKELIEKGILQGKVDIRMRNGEKHPDKWENQLSLLLSNKTTTIKKTVPRLSDSAVWGIVLVASFGVLSTIANQIWDKTDKFSCIIVIGITLLYALPILIGTFLILWHHNKDKNWDWALKLVSQKEDDTIDEEYTSSEEPSVAEFKNWMCAISDFIGVQKGKDVKKKLIIVFDNMDRLPSEKVMQLWSSIYTFFSDGNFENIWAIIPYDFKHLCQAINGEDDSETGTERIKRFIRKTFPLTFNVPQPVITDYELLFNKYFEQAFGDQEHDQQHICQVFRCINPEPNPRDVIAFVNELVAMRLQWMDNKTYRLQNIALFILKKDYILYNDKGSVESNLLSDELFDKVEAFYPAKETVRTQLCQFTYGIDNSDLANELPLSRTLQRNLINAESIAEYHDKTNFVPILEKVVSEINESNIDNAVISLTTLDAINFSNKDKDRIQSKWDFIANKKTETVYERQEFDKTLKILLSHVSIKRAQDLVRHFCKSIQDLEVNDGASYFKSLSELKNALADKWKEIDMLEYLHPTRTEPKHFVEYVQAAKSQYALYQLGTGSVELMDYLLNMSMDDNGESATVVKYLKDDDNYDYTPLRDKIKEMIAKDEIPDNFLPIAYMNRELTTDIGILDCRISTAKVNTFMQSKVINKQYETKTIGFADVLSMYLADNHDIPNCEYGDNVWESVSTCVERYITYTDILKKIGNGSSAIGNLNIYMIHNRVGENCDNKIAAQNIENLYTKLSIDYDVLFKQFDRFGKINWGEINENNTYIKGVDKYVLPTLFEQYKSNQCDFCDSIIELGVTAIEYKPKGFLFNTNNTTNATFNNYWRGFVLCFLGTNHMPKASAHLTQELIAVLDRICSANSSQLSNDTIVEKLENFADNITLDEYLREKMNGVFKTKDINAITFKHFGRLLPRLGSDMDKNTASCLITHFVKPVVDNAECANIIVEHQYFYLGVLALDKEAAQDIIKKMAKNEAYISIQENLKELILNG